MKRENPAGNYMLRVNNKNTRTRCEICSKLTMVSLLQTSGVFLQLRTYFTPCSSVSMVNFEQVNAGWVTY